MAAKKTDDLVIHGGTVYTARIRIDEGTVVVENGRIAAVYEPERTPRRFGPRYRIVNARGRLVTRVARAVPQLPALAVRGGVRDPIRDAQERLPRP